MTAAGPSEPLARYRAKRDFALTAEPRGDHVEASAGHAYVVQKHAASRLHYDFRLELGGVLVSWALPKGPSFDPADKRIAVHVEDHPLHYGSFEGTIPPKQYGAGSVIVWDNGRWEPVGDPVQGMADGKLLFELHGQKLRGRWELVRIAKPGDPQDLWILFKKRGDSFARPRAEYDVLRALPDSVIAKPLMSAPQPSVARPLDRPGKLGHTMPAGAVKAPLPGTLQPQLATLAATLPSAGEWLHEIKFDGYRILARIEAGKAALFTRGGHDWSGRMPKLVGQLERLGLTSAWLDGEIVVLDEAGRPSFGRLQKAFDPPGSGAAEIDYFLFDLPFFDGHDLRAVALSERRRVLKALVDARPTEQLRFSAAFEGEPGALLESACRMGLEGIIAKRADAHYVSRRSATWLKFKCRRRQAFVVAGYTDRGDGTAQIGSLLLGVHGEHGGSGELVSVGSVGTGWDAAEASALKKRLAKIETAAAPFAAGAPKAGRWSKRPAGGERWVEPTLVADVEYAEMTADGQIRHAVYIALRSDIAAATVRQETASTPGDGAPVRSARVGSGVASRSEREVRISHPERVIDASTGTTKLDLVRYCESVAEFMLPHLAGRPCSLVRAPAGVGGAVFFQKHAEPTAIPGVKSMSPALWPDHEALLEVPHARALTGAAQMNVIEFHTWNSTARNIDKPDRMVYDLDPGEGTPWVHVQEGAMLVRGFLQELGLQSWLKTSGGKGLHIVVPIRPRYDFDTVKGFSKAVVEHLARVVPARFVARSGPANRVGKLFVDYLRNGHGATTAAAYSPRARPGLGVSMPVGWEDLSKIGSGAEWTVATAREHLSFQTVDPWSGYWKTKQNLTPAMQALGFRPGAERR